MNTRSVFFKRHALPFIFSMAGVFLALFAAANPDTLNRENGRQKDAQKTWSSEVSAGPASTVQEAWVARYNGPGDSSDSARAITIDSSGNVYVTGYSAGADGFSDFATIKYNSAGQQQWVARYNGPGNSDDGATAIAVDTSGNVYVTGYSTGSGGQVDYATVKCNTSGQQQWVARYEGPGNGEDRAAGIAVDSSGNVYVTGVSLGSGTFQDYATIKYNSAGQQQWVERYNGPANDVDYATAIAIDDLGNVYVTGASKDLRTGLDYATIKYNSAGQEQWVARYNGPSNRVDRATAIAVDASGNVYVSGESYDFATRYDYATIKYDSAGQEQWVARYNGPAHNNDSASAIAVDSLGNVYVTGSSSGGTFDDYATIKYDQAGNQQWVARYNGPAHNNDSATAIAVDGSGNVYVTGYSYDAGGTSPDYATVKYDSFGQEQWVARYNGPGNSHDNATAIAVDASGNVYVTGYSVGLLTGFDYATIKYIQGTTPTPTPTPTATPTPTPTVQVTVQTSPAGLTFSVDGTTYSSAQTFTWTSGSSHTIATTSPQSGDTGVRYVWTNWTGGGAISHTVAPTINKTYTANFRTQYQLTMSHGTGGRVSPSSGWRNSGATVSISATPNSGYSFTDWTGGGTGSYSGPNNPASITMNGPITETSTFTHN